MAKTEAERKEQRRQKKEAEEKAKESPGASSAKKARIQSSSPVPEVVATTPSEQAATFNPKIGGVGFC